MVRTKAPRGGAQKKPVEAGKPSRSRHRAGLLAEWYEANPLDASAQQAFEALARLLSSQFNLRNIWLGMTSNLAGVFEWPRDCELLCLLPDTPDTIRVLAAGQPALIPTSAILPETILDSLPEPVRQQPGHTVLQPVSAADGSVVCLLCQAATPRAAARLCVEPALPMIARALADQLNRHRLGHRLQQVQGDLDRRLFHLLTLLDFSGDFLRHAHHEDTLTNVLFTAMGHLGANAGCLLQSSGDGAELRCRRWRGLPGEALDQLRLPMSDPLVRAVLDHGAPAARLDLGEAWQASAISRIDALDSLVLCGPLKLGDRLLGLFLLGPKLSGDAYGDDDHEFLSILSTQAALAVDNAHLVADLEAARQSLTTENHSLRRALNADGPFRQIIGASDGIQRVLDVVQRVCDTPVSVLISGESGTGKELVARAIHYGGNRAERPFISLNCASLPETLLESELFGIEQGVATGVKQSIGRVEQANGGTLFLDEVGDMSLAMQAKLLRVLQEREVQRVGGRKTITVDVRVVAATNKDLEAAIVERTFREDLYYRLNVVAIQLPPLRQRRDDVALLTRHLLDKALERFDKRGITLAPETFLALTDYPWPGNVRELENEVERLVALGDNGSVVGPEWLSEKIRLAPPLPPRDDSAAEGRLKERVGKYEAEIIQRVIGQHGGNRAAAARQLGLSGEGLRKKMIKYRLA